MYNIALCIPTYKRPKFLKRTIESIINSAFAGSLIKKTDVIICDNDILKSAETVVTQFLLLNHTNFAIQYFHQPRKGLSIIRNELLAKALLLEPDYIVFIDDDEFADIDWLKELTLSITTTKSDMVVGPVISVFEKKTPSFIYCWFKHKQYKDNKLIDFIQTNNLIIRTSFLLRTNICFDERFNTTGAEDTYFGISAIKAGAKIYWAAKAIVYETIPKKRANLNWLFKRKYRGAITFVYILKLEKKYLSLFKKFLISIFYLVIGAIALTMVPFPWEKKYWGLLKIAESLGGFAGFANIKYYEYQ